MKVPRRIDRSICRTILHRTQVQFSSGLAPAVFYPQPTPIRSRPPPNDGRARSAACPKRRRLPPHEREGPGSSPEQVFYPRSRDEPDPTAPRDIPTSLYIPHTDMVIFPYGPSSIISRRPGLRPPAFFTSTSSSLQRYISGAPVVRTKEDLLSIVGQYDGESVDEHFEFLRDIYRRGYAPADGPNITVSNQTSDAWYPLPKDTLAAEPPELEKIQKLGESLYIARMKPELFDPQEAYELYISLPEPRMLYISGALRHILLTHVVERPKTHKGMLRYFYLVSDIKNCGLSLTTQEWNTAISYASRYVGSVTEAETEAALHLWREMDREGHVKSDEVTFNILFDVASKSGNFALAEMIYKEMAARNLPFNRYHHVSLIHYFGLKMDSGGVRAAYREMVQSGEMIDSTVLNCVISGLFQCGEEGEAEHVYDRMRETAPAAASMPHKNYFTERIVTKVLMMFARIGRSNKKFRPLLQAQSSIAPNLQTYRILINYHAYKVGDLNRVTRYLDEMKHFDVPLHGAIFLALFKGFYQHGGFRGSSWSPQRLDHVFSAFINHYDKVDQGLYVSRWMAMWTLKAFAKCFASKEKVVDVYIQLRLRCEGDGPDLDAIEEILHRTLKTL